MDMNVVVIGGRLAAGPEVRTLGDGATLVRYLIAARSDEPRRRIDVVPVVLWDADERATALERGDAVWVTGSVQRRFWSDDQNRRSRIDSTASIFRASDGLREMRPTKSSRGKNNKWLSASASALAGNDRPANTATSPNGSPGPMM